LPPRHLVSAAHQALEAGRIAPASLAQAVIRALNAPKAARGEPARLRLAA